jgi:LPXTG-site transpeptidase (sortase) family protein
MRRRAACLAAVAAAAVAVQSGLAPAGAATRPQADPGRPPQTARPAAVRVLRHARTIRAVRPWTIKIPSIGVAARLITLGLRLTTASPDGLLLPVPSLAEAATDAGWYQFTVVPGTAGNAVIAGHVDTYAGPGVFYNLYRLRPGDAVYVTAGGARQRFDVTSVRELPKSVFPVNQVFGATSKHRLWLITCGGDFDYETGHYLDNIVVSAAWDPARKSKAASATDAKLRQIMPRIPEKHGPISRKAISSSVTLERRTHRDN